MSKRRFTRDQLRLPGTRPVAPLSRLVAIGLSRRQAQGALLAGPVRISCAFGRGGLSFRKREGDGTTPIGEFKLNFGLFRLDRISRPAARVPLWPIQADLGWCDDVGSPAYNRPVRRPFEGRHEALRREDEAYDLLFVLDYNLSPAVRGRGSAIFLHVSRGGAPTEGCIAIARGELVKLARRMAARPSIAFAWGRKRRKRTL